MKRSIPRIIPGIGECELVFNVYEETIADETRMICAVDIDGFIKAKPKAWLRVVRSEIQFLERLARSAGCHELRMAGRDWSRIFPDYEKHPLGAGKNVLRKVLSDG